MTANQTNGRTHVRFVCAAIAAFVVIAPSAFQHRASDEAVDPTDGRTLAELDLD